MTSRIVYWLAYWLAYRLASVSHFLLASQTAPVAVALPPLSCRWCLADGALPMMLGYAVSNNLNPLAMGMIWSFSASGKYFIGRLSVWIAG